MYEAQGSRVGNQGDKVKSDVQRREVSMRDEVIRKARKRGGGVYCFFDKTHRRRVTRSSERE